MDQKLAITLVEIIVAIAAALVLGDYLGHKFGRWRLALAALITVLVVVVAYAIFSAISLA